MMPGFSFCTDFRQVCTHGYNASATEIAFVSNGHTSLFVISSLPTVQVLKKAEASALLEAYNRRIGRAGQPTAAGGTLLAGWLLSAH